MLHFVSSNADKARELQEMLQTSLQLHPLALHEIQTDDLVELVTHKAQIAFAELQQPLLVEDTSLYFLQWRKLPGPLIKWFLQNLTLGGLVEALAVGGNMRAQAVCVLGWTFDGNEVECFSGEVPGQIVSPRGLHGFGWDSIFQPEGSARTFGEMTLAEKQEFSMRALAAEKLRRSAGWQARQS